jgi:maleylpyruvate isomerase
MPGVSAPSREELGAVVDGAAQLVAAIAALTDDDARAPSRLPGWTRGHVLTHLARNADGLRNLAEGAIADEERAMYPSAEQREADIESGSGRPAAALRADVERSHAALVAAWARLSDDEWERPGWSLAHGSRPVRETVRWRRRELLVHLVDLDVGVTPADLPSDFLEDDAAWLHEFRPRETWPDAPW